MSGFSSGGYFSVQLNVASSKGIMGAGILAGGEPITNSLGDTNKFWAHAVLISLPYLKYVSMHAP